MNQEEKIKNDLRKYNFYHIISLTDTVATPGISEYVPSQQAVQRALSKLKLEGKRVLDVGCRDGLFSFEAEKLGAREIIGIDNSLSKGAVELLIPYFGSKVKMVELNLIDLTPETFGKFDLIIFAGVLYHLRYPFWALKLIKDVLKRDGCLVIETAVMLDDKKKALLFCPIETESPYEATSVTFFNLKGLKDTLTSFGLMIEHINLLNNPQYLNNNHRLSLMERVRYLFGKKSDIIIDRATIVCRFADVSPDKQVSDYWNAIHNLE